MRYEYITQGVPSRIVYAETIEFDPTPPVVTGIAPASGTAGTSITITGSGFTQATGVSFGGGPSVTPSGVSDTQLTAVVPAASSTATVDVTVTTPVGTSAATPADQFTYAQPVVSGVRPRTVCSERSSRSPAAV